ncbi:MAG: ATP-binding protein, partial [Proteobacteria bacterium]|nr:ATP-binding protein [Pseudomonadota bacterium]
GPLLDRIDLHLTVPALPTEVLLEKKREGESSAIVRERVETAWQQQYARQGKLNHRLSNTELDELCELEPDAEELVRRAIQGLGLSARAYHRILRVGRTLADLQGEPATSAVHLAEAIQYRQLDRQPRQEVSMAL